MPAVQVAVRWSRAVAGSKAVVANLLQAVQIRFGKQLQPTSGVYQITVDSVILALESDQSRLTKFIMADLDVITRLLKQQQY